MSFARCLAITGELEGGWADDPHDRGGRTRWGVSSAAHPDIDLDALETFEDAVEQVYRPRYWAPIRGDRLPEPVDLAVFDWAVHSYTRIPSRALQRTIGKPRGWPKGKRWADGAIGTKTLNRLAVRVRQLGAVEVAHRVNRARINFMVDGFKSGRFVDGENDRATELIYLRNFWRRTDHITFEIARNGA